ncbi:type II toxin-antitoxin system VapC family toxin [Aeoliella mucimassa]|uniref:type II toxin-antitoxin system VapC family toxin n=1 Tax=Aeoliella mucimassa TaxID=2527972 RepID=UPI0011A2DE58|nr:PIN domain-containing protein [Aeoliella mucimassa]
MIVLLDTNLLLRAMQPSHPDSGVARSAMHSLRAVGHQLCVVPQVVYEFWVVATRPTEVNGLGLSTERANLEVDRMVSLFPLRRDERSVFDHWRDLVATYQVAGKKAHDCRLVAAMVRHGISHILSFNHADFTRFEEITAISPAKLDIQKR